MKKNNLKLKSIVSCPKSLIRKLIQLFDILLKPLLKHIKTFIRDGLNFLIKWAGDLDEYTELLTFDVITLCTKYFSQIWPVFLNYFFTMYQEDLPATLKKEFVLESTNFILKKRKLIFDYEFYLQFLLETPNRTDLLTLLSNFSTVITSSYMFITEKLWFRF